MGFRLRKFRFDSSPWFSYTISSTSIFTPSRKFQILKKNKMNSAFKTTLTHTNPNPISFTLRFFHSTPPLERKRNKFWESVSSFLISILLILFYLWFLIWLFSDYCWLNEQGWINVCLMLLFVFMFLCNMG